MDTNIRVRTPILTRTLTATPIPIPTSTNIATAIKCTATRIRTRTRMNMATCTSMFIPATISTRISKTNAPRMSTFIQIRRTAVMATGIEGTTNEGARRVNQRDA